MKIDISPELRSMMDSKLEDIKKDFIREQFAFSPLEAERFSITGIEEQCLVYPKGTFMIEGEYTYGEETFLLHTYLRGDETQVTIIGVPEPKDFSSMEKAISYCKNYICFQPTRIGEQFPVMAQSLKLLLDSIINKELSSLSDEDAFDISLQSYSLSHMVYSNNAFENNLSLVIVFIFRKTYYIRMIVTTIDDHTGINDKNEYGLYFIIDGQHIKPFTSLKEVVTFIKEYAWDVPKDLN